MEALTRALELHLAGDFERAEAIYRDILLANPWQAESLHFLGVLLSQRGQHEAALELMHRSIDLQPHNALFYCDLGVTYQSLGKVEAAAASLEKSIVLQPDYAEGHGALGVALSDLGRIDQALAHLEREQQLRPSDWRRIMLVTRLPVIPQSLAELEKWRSRLVEGIHDFQRRGVTLDVTQEGRPSLFLLAYQGLNDVDIQRDLGRLFRAPQPTLRPPATNGKIRIGFISTFFWMHTIGHLMRGLIAQLDRNQFEVTVLTFGDNGDAVCRFVKQHADHFVLAPRNLPAARKLIVDLQLDVLFYTDIGMDPTTTTLACSRLAPVQCATWGHPSTTGIDTLDYFISSQALETDDGDSHYTEELVRPKTLPIYYYRPELPVPPKAREHFGLTAQEHIYACPQTLFKFHPEFDAILGAILRRDPQGTLVLLKAKHPHWEQLLRQRFAMTLPDVQHRIRILPNMDRGDFLNLLALSDVVLDPVHFGGGNTSYEGLAMGTPIVTLPSQFLRGRITFALYKQMGVLDCVAQNAQEYVDIALRLGMDAAYRDGMRQKILAACPVLYENGDGIRELEQFFLSVCRPS
ncbi:MAG TPA: tetratricopeptide repeat protein [Gemmataceae bacterium]|nr:tetratricopeptide repeat protein [Gemmataceae bacterium]